MIAALSWLLLTGASPQFEIADAAEIFAPGIASTTGYAEIRLTISPDGRTALWFSRDRPGGPGGYDIWMSRRSTSGWSTALPVSFNAPGRDFDPAFSRDGAHVYFCSDRPGGLGGDDIWRVAVTETGFARPEHLGPNVNSAANEFAPMLSPDGKRLLFSSDRPGGAGRHDLMVSRRKGRRFAPATALPGGINTPADEFDATFLPDNMTIVFARAGNMRTDRVALYEAGLHHGRYDPGLPLPQGVNSRDKDSYGAMIDWSVPNRLLWSAQGDGARTMDLYLVRFRPMRKHGHRRSPAQAME